MIKPMYKNTLKKLVNCKISSSCCLYALIFFLLSSTHISIENWLYGKFSPLY